MYCDYHIGLNSHTPERGGNNPNLIPSIKIASDNFAEFIQSVEKMINIKLNNKREIGLNPYKFITEMLSHSQNPVDNKILCVKEVTDKSVIF